MAAPAPARARCPEGRTRTSARSSACRPAAAATPRGGGARDVPPARSLRRFWPLKRGGAGLSLAEHAAASRGGGIVAGQEVDIVLSSGFLAFAYHAGFLAAVEDAGLQVGGVMGTSAGALTGALYAAGYRPSEVASILSERTPWSYLSFNEAPLGGLLRLDGAIARLRELLPSTFAGLERRYACGVVDASGNHRTISSGSLPEAVVASMAIPCLFRAVDMPWEEEGPFKDGGKADRVGLLPWLSAPALATPGRTTICHVIARSSPFSGNDDVAAMAKAAPPSAGPIVVCRSPKSDQSLLGLPDFEPQFVAARDRAAATLARAGGGAVTAR